jgi:regulator of replication initiation timing
MRLLLYTILLFTFQTATSQTPKDYFNKEVQTGQQSSTNTIMTSLENNQIEKALDYFYSNTSKTTLEKISTEIRKIKKETKLSIVIVYAKGFNIYKCRYCNDKRELLLLDLYFTEGDANSKVQKLVTKNAKTLEMEKEERMKSNDIPPSPPN